MPVFHHPASPLKYTDEVNRRQPRVFFAQGFSKKENSSGGKIQ
jgi:hypothetical protein